MDHFREPEPEEVQLFLESTGTHGSLVSESALEIDCSETRIQSRQSVLFDSDDTFSSLN
ncbi:hypothetical protein ACSAZK_08245 [Methanosarcina sp. Mfa9]|uniref:hypothetical protein n=1 Tax=unclassified Methanosarcina TaxID=2644672 RepID=UPI001E5B9F11|nr:hypothetical protein [Methanosarcina sp. MTP4]